MVALTRPTSYLIFGQSYGFSGYSYSTGLAHFAMTERTRSAIDASTATVQARLAGNPALTAGSNTAQRRMAAITGSAVLAKHDAGAGYWVANDAVTAGPLMTDALAIIASAATKPTWFVYSHLESAVGFALVTGDVTLTRTAIENVMFAQLRAASWAASPTLVPIFVDILGHRFAGQEVAEYAYRDMMIDMIAAGTNVFRGAEKYALRLDATTHPSPDAAGYAQMGAHTARKVESWMLTGVPDAGPSIASAVRTGNNVAVTVTVPSGKTLVKPAQPDFFGMFNGSGVAIDITGYSWAGNVLTLTAASQPATMRYPVPMRVGSGPNKVTDISRIVRLSDPASPIYTGEPGLVLESAKAFSL